ncbi:MAG: hypothetical protein PVI66_17645 [Candidatus Aminicenantes bacterium]|jgi:hypothetical protein
MRNPKNWLWFILFGSLWGINEVVMGEVLSTSNVPHYSVLLTVIALFILALARGIVNRPGSSTAIGLIAVLFKLANAAPFYCHLLGIFMVGLTFDVFASLLIKSEKTSAIKSGLTGFLSAYSGNALFALVITYIIRYDIWTSAGLPKILEHIFIAGSLTAVCAAIAVPLGFKFGTTGGVIADKRPKWTYAGTVVTVCIIWILARALG